MAISDISKQIIKDSEIVTGSEIRQGVFNLIREEYPDFNGDSILYCSHTGPDYYDESEQAGAKRPAARRK